MARANHMLSMVEVGVLTIAFTVDEAAARVGKMILAAMLTLPEVTVSLTSLASLNVWKRASRKPSASNVATSPAVLNVALAS